MEWLAIFTFLILTGIVLIKALIPIAIVGGLIFIAISIICAIFDEESVQRIIGIGCVLLIPGIIICIQSKDKYHSLISGSLVIGGPRPSGVLLAMFGFVFLIYGIIKYLINK